MKKVFVTILFFLIIGGPLAYRGFYNYKGYCFDESRYLTSDEKYRSAMRWAFASYPQEGDKVKLKNGELKVVVNLLEYRDFEAFYNKNVNCCELTQTAREGFKPIFSTRILGNFLEFVSYEYSVDANDFSLKHKDYVAMRNCGKPWSGI